MTRDEAQALLDTVPLHANLGIEMDRYDEGHVTFRFTPPSAARSPDGMVHGGVLATRHGSDLRRHLVAGARRVDGGYQD
jgi:acyl-coenzyme A thioesterase PaaI-like protein